MSDSQVVQQSSDLSASSVTGKLPPELKPYKERFS